MKILGLVFLFGIAAGIECSLLPRLTFDYCQNVMDSNINFGNDQMDLLTFNYCDQLINTVKKDYHVSSFNGKKYYFSKFIKDWWSGEIACIELGGHLTSISSLDEYNFIYHAANSKYSVPVWIGLKDLNQQGQYEWSDGTAVGFTHWINGEPNNSNEQCVFIWEFSKGYNNAGWNDSNCSHLHYFICKI